MKYREWAGHSASLTSLYSAIRLSAIMAHHLSLRDRIQNQTLSVVLPSLEPYGIS